MNDKIIIEMGYRGIIYDEPNYLRGFSYNQQPNSEHSYNLGVACIDAMKMPSGDMIDRGLCLLKSLEAQGYGVFMLPTNEATYGTT